MLVIVCFIVVRVCGFLYPSRRPIDCTELPISELDAAQLVWIMGDIDRSDAAVALTPVSFAGSRMTKPTRPLTMAGQTL